MLDLKIGVAGCTYKSLQDITDCWSVHAVLDGPVRFRHG